MKDFKVQAGNLWAFIAGILVFLISLYIEPKYLYGDQEHYREFFNYCFYDGYSHTMQLFCYQNTLGSTEPGYFYLSKIAHLFLEKDIYISFANSILVFLLIKLVFKWYENIWHRYFFIFLVLTNYYLIVLMFAAERLKFSFIFLVLALLVAKQWKRIIIFGLALFTHVQSALLIATFFISKVLDKNTKLWVKIIISLICIIGFTGAFLLMQEHIVNKLGAYSEGTEEDGNGFISMIKTGVFIFLAGISTFRILPVISGIPLVLLSYFLGSERIGMLAFILYVCAVIYYKKKADLLLFLVMLYFTIKTPSFILNILN
ncbi:TPA: hypothetical protein JI291_21130, partial [Acinetobacter baumannii]|nr:hypothetical protein [Acinetobacter baumannii]